MLTPNEVLGTLDEMGVDKDSKQTNRLPNPFEKFGNEDDGTDDIGPMAYTDVTTGESYNIYNLAYDPRTENINKRSKEAERAHKAGNMEINMDDVYRLSGNRKIKGEQVKFAELDMKSMMKDQAHVQKHLKVFNE